MGYPKIMDDKRQIQSLSTATDFWNVGYGGVVGIEPYEENGHMAPVLWFAIYYKDKLEGLPFMRVGPSLDMVIEYK